MTSTPAPTSVQRLTWLLLVAAVAAAAWLLVHAARVRPGYHEVDLLAAVPAGPDLLFTADVAALGRDAAEELLQAGGGALLGLRELCGFEPLLGLRRVVLAMPRGVAGEASDFALIAETSLDAESVLRCAEAVVRKRGGTPVRSSLGAFTSVRDQNKPLGEIAMRPDGLFVLSGGKYFREVIDSASGVRHEDESERLRSRVHLAVRNQLGPSQLAITLLVGPRLPLPGVQALGLALNVRREVLLRGYVVCPSASGCSEAANLIGNLRDDAVRDSGIAGLANVTVTQHEQRLDIKGQLGRAELAPLLKQLLVP
ncbi:MAG TPA: hypothetical protein VHB79_30710 [Polyangiaceae bacterium]|nr:hypothetical protein [Polyangiaceae bacterium]